MSHKQTAKLTSAISKQWLERARQTNAREEFLSKRINKLEGLVRLMANTLLDSGIGNAEAFKGIIESAKPDAGEFFRCATSQEIGELDGLETLIAEFDMLTGQAPDPEEPA